MMGWLMQSTMASASAEKKQDLADAMIDDHPCQLQERKQQQVMATMTTTHNVPTKIMTLSTAMDTLDVHDKDTD